MRGVRFDAYAIEYQDVQASKFVHRGGGNYLEIRRIRKIIESISDHRQLAMDDLDRGDLRGARGPRLSRALRGRRRRGAGEPRGESEPDDHGDGRAGDGEDPGAREDGARRGGVRAARPAC